jgi:hypothetical protein
MQAVAKGLVPRELVKVLALVPGPAWTSFAVEGKDLQFVDRMELTVASVSLIQDALITLERLRTPEKGRRSPSQFLRVQSRQRKNML